MRNSDFVELIRNVKVIKYQYKKLVGRKENDTLIKSFDNNLAFYLWQDVREAEYFAMNELDFNMIERFIFINIYHKEFI